MNMREKMWNQREGRERLINTQETMRVQWVPIVQPTGKQTDNKENQLSNPIQLRFGEDESISRMYTV